MRSVEEMVEILEEGGYLSPELQNEIAVMLVANEALINQLIEWNSKANVRAEIAEDRAELQCRNFNK